MKNSPYFLLASGALVSSVYAGDELRVSTIGKPLEGVGGGQVTLRHVAGATEQGADGYDAFWSNAPAQPYDQWLQIGTMPYGSYLRGDFRPELSETLFEGLLTAHDPFDFGGVNLSSGKLEFNFINAGEDTNRVYMGKATLSDAYTANGQPFTWYGKITNGTQVTLPGIVSVPHNATYGGFEVSAFARTGSLGSTYDTNSLPFALTNGPTSVHYSFIPQHGTIQTNDATHFTYVPAPGSGSQGSDLLTIVAHHPVTGVPLDTFSRTLELLPTAPPAPGFAVRRGASPREVLVEGVSAPLVPGTYTLEGSRDFTLWEAITSQSISVETNVLSLTDRVLEQQKFFRVVKE